MTVTTLRLIGLAMIVATPAACSDDDGDEAPICEGDAFRCTHEVTGEDCTDGDLDCICECVLDDSGEGEGEGEGGPAYRYILIEDLTEPVAGEYPGAELDAVSLVKPDGTRYLETVVDAFDHTTLIPQAQPNMAADPHAALGPPDAQCSVEFNDRFYSMGGSGSFLIATVGDDVSIDIGDKLIVHVFGFTECGLLSDGDYEVSVSSSPDLSSFVPLGVGFGMQEFDVQELP